MTNCDRSGFRQAKQRLSFQQTKGAVRFVRSAMVYELTMFYIIRVLSKILSPFNRILRCVLQMGKKDHICIPGKGLR